MKAKLLKLPTELLRKIAADCGFTKGTDAQLAGDVACWAKGYSLKWQDMQSRYPAINFHGV